MSESLIILSFWTVLSLILAISTAGNNYRFLQFVFILMIFGPIGRLIAPGSLIGSFWAFDLLLFLGLIIRFWQKQIVWPKNNLAPWFLLFSLIGLTSSLFIFPLSSVIKAGLYSIRWLAYFLAIFALAEIDGKNLHKLKIVLLLVSTILVIFGLVQLSLLPNISNVLVAKYAFDPHVKRLFSTWFDPNYLGGFLVLALLLNLREIGRRGIIGLISGLVLIGILLTLSRSSYLALIFGLIVFGFYKSPKLILTTVLGLVLATSFLAPVRERVYGAITLDTTAKARLSSWQRAIDVIKTNPVIGYGYNLYAEADLVVGHRYLKENVPYRPAASGSDSSLLNIWATTGVGGLIVYFLIISQIWQFGTASERSALTSLLVHSLFVNSLLLPPFMLVFWVVYKGSIQDKFSNRLIT